MIHAAILSSLTVYLTVWEICRSLNSMRHNGFDLPLMRGWAAFAADTGLGLPLIRRRVAEISKEVLEKAAAVAEELSRPELDRTAIEQFANMIRDRADRCALTIAGAMR